MNADGLLMSFARWNHEMGSQQSVAPVCVCRPSGTPIMGVPVPTANGQSPHTWTVVPRHSSGAWT